MPIDVSVIVPIYNMAGFIPAGIESLKKQSGVEMEIILVNDGSKDDSAAVCEKCIADDKRFRLINTENRGSGPARNTGIENAAGEYLYFFDIDDSLRAGALQSMMARAREAKCDLLVFGFTERLSDAETPKIVKFADTFVDGDEARAHYEKYMEGETSIQGAPWNKLFRRDVTIDNKVEYPPLRRNQDEGFIMRYMRYAKTIRIVPDVLYDHLRNTQERMWLKYRLDYGDNIEALFDLYSENIVAWNPNNENVKKILYRLYFLCTLNALRVLYNPKWKLSQIEIYKGVKKQVRRWQTGAKRYETTPVDHMVAGSTLYPYMLKGRYFMVYLNFAVKAIKKAVKKA